MKSEKNRTTNAFIFAAGKTADVRFLSAEKRPGRGRSRSASVRRTLAFVSLHTASPSQACMNVPTSARVRRVSGWGRGQQRESGERAAADFTPTPPLATRVNQQFRRAGMSGASRRRVRRPIETRVRNAKRTKTHPRPCPEVLRRSHLYLPCRRGRRNRGHPGIFRRTHARRPRILCPREVSWSCAWVVGPV